MGSSGDEGAELPRKALSKDKTENIKIDANLTAAKKSAKAKVSSGSSGSSSSSSGSSSSSSSSGSSSTSTSSGSSDSDSCDEKQVEEQRRVKQTNKLESTTANQTADRPRKLILKPFMPKIVDKASKERSKPMCSVVATEHKNNRNELPLVYSDLEKLRSMAIDLQPYTGQLMPDGQLQSAKGFASTCASFLEFSQIHGDNPIDPASQLMQVFAPKLDELKQMRRFCPANLNQCAMSCIARGSSWEIHRQTFQEKQKVAVKIITNYKDPLDIVKEVHTLIRLQSNRVVKLLGAFHHGQTHLVMPLMQGFLGENILVLTERQKIKFTLQLLQAVWFIHQENILHLDINPDNIFITQDNNAVLGNFGSSQLIPNGVRFLRLEHGQPILGRKCFNDAFANSGVYSKASDVFSLGCVIYQIDTGEPLMQYKNWDAPIAEYIKVARKGRLIQYPPRQVSDASGADDGFDLDGNREPLLNRVNKSVFKCFLSEMTKHSESKQAVAEILEDNMNYFNKVLSKDGTKLSDVSTDSEFGCVQLFPKNSDVPVPQNLSRTVNVALDNVYFDANVGKQSSFLEESITERVVPADLLRKTVDELIEKNRVHVNTSPTINDPPQSTSDIIRSIVDNMARNTAKSQVTYSVKETSETVKPQRTAETIDAGKETLGVDQPMTDVLNKEVKNAQSVNAAKQTPNRRKYMPKMQCLPSNLIADRSSSTLTGNSKTVVAVPTSSSATAASTKHQTTLEETKKWKGRTSETAASTTKVTRTYQKRKPKEDANKKENTKEDVLKKKPVKRLKTGKQKNDEHIDDDSGADEDSRPFVTRGTGSVPVEERGRPAPFTNLPEYIRKAQNLGDEPGWMDCQFCQMAWFTDYLEWKDHVKNCDAYMLKNRTGDKNM